MSAPICRVCKKAHWPREAHRWDVAAAHVADGNAAEAVANADTEGKTEGIAEGNAEGKKVLMRQIDCEKYNAYMREYMRAYRAKRKAEALNG